MVLTKDHEVTMHMRPPMLGALDIKTVPSLVDFANRVVTTSVRATSLLSLSSLLSHIP